jgi:hypothetical protein
MDLQNFMHSLEAKHPGEKEYLQALVEPDRVLLSRYHG